MSAVVLACGILAVSPLDDTVPAPVTGVPLPTIGHTISQRRACAVLRDVISPSLQAAINSDNQFAAAREQLAEVAKYSKGSIYADQPSKQMALVRLDAMLAGIANDVHIVADALGDPRLSADQTDPDLRAERLALQQFYEVTKVQLDSLSDVSDSGHFTTLRDDDADMMRVREAIGKPPPSNNVARTLATPPPERETPPPNQEKFQPATGAMNPDAFRALKTPLVIYANVSQTLPSEIVKREAKAAQLIIALASTCQ